jgi:glycosyltransferase involved in cell wall biosynthesis
MTQPAIQAPPIPSPGKLVVFDTHPIQYRSPVFRELYRQHPEFRVYYFADQFDSNRWWFHEVGKSPKQDWDLPLREGFPNEVVTRPYPGILGFLRAASEILRRERPRAIVIYGYYLPEHWALWWLARYYQVPILFIGETMTRATTSWRSAIKGALQPLFFRGISQFISIGHRSAAFYQEFSIPDEHITRAKYCIDTKFFELSAEEGRRTRERLRENLGLPTNAVVILFVGRLFERKRPQDVLALHQLLENPRVHTLVVGNGPMEADLRKAGANLSRLQFLGFKNQAETRDLYYAADLLFVPSEYETWGLVVNEAAAAGLPSIVTEDCGAANDLVESGETGFVYPVGNLNRVARVMKGALEDPRLLPTWGRKARERVRAHYRVDQFAQAMLNALSVAVGR